MAAFGGNPFGATGKYGANGAFGSTGAFGVPGASFAPTFLRVPLISTGLASVGNFTYSRSGGAYALDCDGRWVPVAASYPAFPGLRIERNECLNSRDLSQSSYTKAGTCTVSGTNTVNLPANADRLIAAITKPIGAFVSMSAVFSGTPGETISMYLFQTGTGGVAVQERITLTAVPTRYCISGSISSTSVTYCYFAYRLNAADTATQVTIDHCQVEIKTGQSNQNPAEIITTGSTAVSQCFNYANPNTVNETTGEVTDSGNRTVVYTGNGLQVEPTSTNICTCYGVPRVDSLSASVVTGNNSTFSGVTGWTWTTFSLAALDVTTVPGKMFMSCNAGSANAAGLLILTEGKWYSFSVKLRQSGGTPRVVRVGGYYTAGGVAGVDFVEVTPTSTEQTFTGYFQRNGSFSLNIAVMYGTAGDTFEVDDVLVYEAVDKVGTKNYHNGTAWVNTAITGLSFYISSPTTATLSIVDSTTAVNASPYANLCNGGKVYRIDNTDGATPAWVVTASLLATKQYSRQVIARVVSGGGGFRTSYPATLAPFSGSTFALYKAQGVTQINSSVTSIYADANSVVEFIVPQIEEGPVCTSLNPTSGTTIARVATAQTVSTSGVLPAAGPWAIAATFTAAQTTGTQTIFHLRTDASNFLHLSHTGAVFFFEKCVGGISTYATIVQSLVAGTAYRVKLRRNPDNTYSLWVGATKGSTGFSAEMCKDPGFDNPVAWSGVNWRVSGGVATHTPGSTSSMINRGGVVILRGAPYMLSLTVTAISAGSVYSAVGNPWVIPFTLSAPGTASGISVANTLNDSIYRAGVPSTDFAGSIDDASCKLVLNNTSATALATPAALYIGCNAVTTTEWNGYIQNVIAKSGFINDSQMTVL